MKASFDSPFFYTQHEVSVSSYLEKTLLHFSCFGLLYQTLLFIQSDMLLCTDCILLYFFAGPLLEPSGLPMSKK